MRFNLDSINYNKSDLRKGIILPEQLSPELAEETGLHIGDGTMNFYMNKGRHKGKYSLRGHINDDVKHYDNRIKKLYKLLYNLEIKLSKVKSTGVYGFQVWTDSIVNFKHKILKLPIGKKLNIRIPNCFIDKYFIDVVRGIFDTDGCLYLEHKNSKLYPRIQIATISRELSEQLKGNLLRHGFRTTVFVEDRKDKGWNNLYTISIRGEEMLQKWMKIINPANPKHISKFNFFIEHS